MALAPRIRLGPYELGTQIGAGGMGEVYRALDTRLNRTVAIKVISGEQTSRPDFNLRFEREARVISSFNHPNICTIHDFGRQDNLHYLVMEHLEGETLADRLLRGPLPLDEFFRYACQIADALDHAHRHGHVHRDVKPANVMLTKSGAKLLDFGLARAVGRRAAVADETVSEAITRDGMLVGTYPYMSPEQLRGRETDARSDIFSFGAVLYEMAAAKRAFAGEDAASVIAAVLDHEPKPLSEIRPILPRTLDLIMKSCLHKDPDERLQSAHDLKLELELCRNIPFDNGAEPAMSKARMPWPALAIGLLIGAAVTGLIAAAWARLGEPEQTPQAVRFELAPAVGTSFATTTSASAPVIDFSISPDGSKIVFVAEQDGLARLWVRSLREVNSYPLIGTEGAQQPFWSPDSRNIAFFAQNELKRIGAHGGPATPLSPVSVDPRGGAWLSSDTIVYANDNRSRLMQIPASGGQARPVFPDEGVVQQWFPSPLPDGRRFVYFDRSKRGVFVGSIDGNQSERIVTTQWAAVYAHPNYLLYLKNGALVAHEFDALSGSVRGEPATLSEAVAGATNGMIGLSASWSGILVQSQLVLDKTRLMWYDRDRQATTNITEPAYDIDPRLSPDGRRIAWARLDPLRFAYDLWVHDPQRGTTTRLTSDPFIEAAPIWSADGRKLLYRSNRLGLINLFIRDLASGSEAVLFTTDSQYQQHSGSQNPVPTDWSKDGRYLIYTHPGTTGYDVYTRPLESPSIPVRLANSRFNEIHGALSPDQRWLAFASDESGRLEVYLQSFPEGNSKQAISVNGGSEPQWRSDGKELYFLAPRGKMMSANVTAAGDVGNSRELFGVRTPSPNPFKRNYHPSADGQRFVVNMVVDEGQPTSALTVVMNWRSQLNGERTGQK